jgi:hypothetical protein
MRSIGLCMIVKNERHVIERCLNSVKSLIDYVLVEDTGSTDGTQEIVREWLRKHNIPGHVIEEPWQDFAYNRSHVMAALRDVQTVDYALVIDADDEMFLEPDFDTEAFKRALQHDFYDVQVRSGSTVFQRAQLCSNKLPFCYKAVLHEFLASPAGSTRGAVSGFHINSGRTGARNQNPNKYQDDAATLEAALLTETDPFLIARYTFYLAQSYRDCGEVAPALANYIKRSELGFWTEEIYISLYQAAKLKEKLGAASEDVIQTYLKAAETSPARAEALHGAARYCHFKGLHQESYQYAKRALEKTRPDGALFSETWIYDYGALDEFAVSCFWSGRHREAVQACTRLLASAALPADQRDRVTKNAHLSLEKLPNDPNPARFHAKDLIPARHAPQPARLFSSHLGDPAPKILVAILAKQKEQTLPLYLRCLEALDYPKDRIVLYIRTNNNTDQTQEILAHWIDRNQGNYDAIDFDFSDVEERVQDYEAHEWNAIRFKILGEMRQHSLGKMVEYGCDYYFTADVNNFLRPFALRELVALNLPIVAPFLRHSEENLLYSNFHADIDDQGYYRDCDSYLLIWGQKIAGVFELPVVHCTYLVRSDVISHLKYRDATTRHEYVIFSESARQAGVPQFFDNRQVYGYLTMTEEPAHAERLLGPELDARLAPVFEDLMGADRPICLSWG